MMFDYGLFIIRMDFMKAMTSERQLAFNTDAASNSQQVPIFVHCPSAKNESSTH